MIERLEHCTICPRNCGARRENDHGSGFCGMGVLPSLARAALHFWEEPCISGTRGSGTVFFTGCALRCVFCQNAEISNAGFSGKIYRPKELSALFFRLVEQGAHNINLVNPTHFAPAVAEALAYRKLPVPVVYNCGGYESVKTLRELEGLVDIYLPDFKYGKNDVAKRYSRAPDYVEVALLAIAEMVRQRGGPVFDEAGMLQSGVLVRHLLLPGNTQNAMEALRLLKEHFGSEILVSLMAQYVPCGKVNDEQYSELNRRITKRELSKVEAYLYGLGMEGFVQERSSAQKDFIPSFHLEGL
ncbi:MAG: radical SAM protein [Oscillospiraceae bacterium]|nr:radical SAM protein [Oscillospiraceae bacterium]